MPSGIYTRTEEHRETLRKNLLQARAKRFGGQQLELVEEAPAVDGRERKHSKFVELANKRTSNVLYSMDILQKCFDKSLYVYSEDEVNKIVDAIMDKLAQIQAASQRGTSRDSFEL